MTLALLVLVNISCISATRERQAAAQTDLGAAYLTEGELSAAVEALERATKQDPRNWDAWQKLGLAYAASRAEEKAHKAFTKALRIKPRSGEINANYGAYLMSMGDVDAAIEHFEVAREDLTYRNPALVLNNLGYAQFSKGEYDKAIEALSDAIRRAPNQCHARLHRGMAWQAKDEHKRALADFEAVIELCQGSVPAAYLGAGRSLFATGQDQAACVYLEAAMQDDPDGTRTNTGEQALQLYGQRCGRG